MKKLLKLNGLITSYNGLIAKWKSSGGKGAPPQELIELIEQMETEIIRFLITHKDQVAR